MAFKGKVGSLDRIASAGNYPYYKYKSFLYNKNKRK